MANTNTSPPNKPRGKRRRGSPSAGDQHPVAQQTVVDGSALPATRAGLACEACRVRKIRCVGFPSCTWCQQRHQPCIRGQNNQTSPLDEWGNQILDALARAKDEILSAATTSSLPSNAPLLSPGSASGGIAQNGSQQILSAEGILQWGVLTSSLADLPEDLVDVTHPEDAERLNQSSASADTSLATLQELTQRFERKFWPRYPILSRVQLQRYVRDVAENGGEWNAETCLVLLMCALASLCDCSAVDEARGAHTIVRSPFSPGSTTTSVQGPSMGSRPSQQAYQYWVMAKRRLGWVLDIPNGLLSAQCLCLAGFWHLQNCAPKKAKMMFHRAVESVRHQKHYSKPPEQTKALIKLVSLVCTDQIRRLDIELGLYPLSGTGVALPETFLHSSITVGYVTSPLADGVVAADPVPNQRGDTQVYLQLLIAVRADINNLLAWTPSVSCWQDLYALLGQIADCRSRLDKLANESMSLWRPSQQDGEDTLAIYAATEDVRNRELANLLRACLYLHLSPNLLQSLINNSPAVHSHQHILNEAAGLAVECITLTVQILRLYLERWQDEGPHLSQRSTPQSASSRPCHHLEAWYSYRFVYAGCLLLLAVHHAKTRAFNGDTEYAYCRSLTLPMDWWYVVAGHTRVLSRHDEGSSLWQGGQLLSCFHMTG